MRIAEENLTVCIYDFRAKVAFDLNIACAWTIFHYVIEKLDLS
jgi:hypothetical protein